MRSAAEIRFRLGQEANNLTLWIRPPALPEAVLGELLAGQGLPLPSGETVKSLLAGTQYAEDLSGRARRIVGGELPAFDTWIQPDGAIRWRKDYRHGQETEPVYFRRVPYLDFSRAGDHKWIWEINRHQHLVALAQAWILDPRSAYVDTIAGQLESWLDQNPPQSGINWTSALEVAFRALSWIWIWHWAGSSLPQPLARRLLHSLYHHGLHLAANLSIYFSPNTHLLGEALVLDALGRLFPSFPGADGWRKTGSREMRLALERQTGIDGSHFEQSSYYHVYALDMFLLHRVLAGPGSAVEEVRIAQMADFLTVLLGDAGRIPLTGDDDGGRLFSPFGARDTFGRGTLALYGVLTGGPAPAGIAAKEAAAEMAVWWLGERVEPWLQTAGARPPRRSRLFRCAGLAVCEARGVQILADGGPMGPGSAGHSHADALQLLARRNGRDVWIDPGTGTYIADPALRDRFRGTAAHNTVTVGGAGPDGHRPDQAIPAGPFRWLSPPRVRLLGWETGEENDRWEAECAYRNIRHRRMLRWDKNALRLWIVDEIEWGGPDEVLPLTQHWHLGEEPEPVRGRTIFCAGARFALEPEGELTIERTERSLVLGSRQPGWCATLHWQSASPARRVTVLDWEPEAGELHIAASWNRNSVTIRAQGDPGRPPLEADFTWDIETQ